MNLELLQTHPELFWLWLGSLLIGLSIHECAHALAANQLGDSTAKDLGRLTLNPLSHIDWLGAMMLVLVGFGWGKPVPVNPNRLKYGKWGELIVAMAGPFSNFCAILFFGLFLKLSIIGGFITAPDNLLVALLTYLILINSVLMLFNLLPFPPLDGSKVLFTFLPDKYVYVRHWLETKGPLVLFFLLIMDSFSPVSFFHYVFYPAIQGILSLFI